MMQLYSTKNKESFFSLEQAVLKGLPSDNGLFMPNVIPIIETDFWDNIGKYSFEEIAFKMANTLINGAVPENVLGDIINEAVNFPAPVVSLNKNTSVLELFHGPTLAFKDFGARFMAGLMSYFNRDNDTELVILVATSGDTGGAVASGFYQKEGIKVVILYPSKKVSFLQEQQLTTLGHNISALEVDGTFDDCQAMVKKAFLDDELNKWIRLSSANSINIARLIPQSFYYAEAFKQLGGRKDLVFSIPSGNFGNLSAGLFAKRMGMPVHAFLAATNINDVVPQYLNTGVYKTRPSKRTISNAMDVGSPSNFNRMMDLYGSTWNNIRQDIKGYSYNDVETKACITDVFHKTGYTLDPHGAVGYLAYEDYAATNPKTHGVVLETAHPSKFSDTVAECIGKDVGIPERLSILANREKSALFVSKEYESLKSYLKTNF